MAWNFRVQIIQEWCSVTLTISQKVVADLVIKTPSIRSLSMPGIPELKSEENIAKKTTGGPAHVSFQPFLDPIATLDGPVKNPSYYCWHRAIYMLQNPVYLEPLNFQTAIHVRLAMFPSLEPPLLNPKTPLLTLFLCFRVFLT